MRTPALIAAEAITRGAVQVPGELEDLIALLQQRQPRCVVEIGTDQGGSFYAWSQVAASDATLVSIDLPSGRWASSPNRLSQEQLEQLATPGQTVVSIIGDSHDAEIQREATEAAGDGGVDFLFIDGDHSFDGVALDYWAYQRLVRPGGVIAFHDIAEHTPASEVMVSGFWSKIKHQHPETFEFTTPGCQWGGIGVLVK